MTEKERSMCDLFRLDGKTALVTGASRGLGWAMARAMAEAGAHVVLNARDAARLQARADELAGTGLDASTVAFDVTDEAASTAAVADIVAGRGRLDVVVANAGIQHRAPVTEFATADFRRLVETNLTAVFWLAREAARPMLRQGHGRIIVTGSIMGMVGRPNIVPYTATKGAVMGMVKSLAAELGPSGITCNAIAPGYFATEMNTALVNDAAFSAWVESRTALRRWGQPREIAGAAVFLASAAGAYVTGQTLTVDGGTVAMA
jgi:gluconate 5-dehydrogenase